MQVERIPCGCGCGILMPSHDSTGRRRRYATAGHAARAQAERVRRPEAIEARFWAKVDKSGDCWLWTSARCGVLRKYGQFMVNGSRKGPRRYGLAHRVALELSVGPIPEGMIVRHLCDTPLCCNPAHMELGSHADNMRDSVGRDRRASKLHHPQVREIRDRYAAGGVSQKRLAEEFGVSQSQISRAVRWITWAEVP